MSNKLHLIAIGGAVMHNLAIALKNNGDLISGSDDHIAEPSKSRLQSEELLPPRLGWFPENIQSDLDGVILGMHARADNPELAKALELNLPVWSFPEFIYRKSAEKLRIALCGSHGKTTITAMVMHVLQRENQAFDYMVGAQLAGFDVMVRLSDAPIIVLEGDEYLASAIDRRPKFLHYQPKIALISGIAWDHMNVFPTFQDYLNAFRGLIKSLEPDAHLVYHAGDPTLCELVAEGCMARLHPYQTPDYQVDQGVLKIRRSEKELLPMSVIGEHNLLNAAGAAAVVQILGLNEPQVWQALADFPGAARRLEVIARGAGKTVIRDFAHSPSKVTASTKAVAGQFGRSGFTACLELHTFSSLNPEFLPQYQGALDAAETAIVFFDPEAISAKKLPPLTEQDVRTALNRPDIEVYTQSSALMERLKSSKEHIKCLLMMSSGPFGGMAMGELANFITTS